MKKIKLILKIKMVEYRMKLPVTSKTFHKVFFSMKLRKNGHVQFACHSCGMGYDEESHDDYEY